MSSKTEVTLWQSRETAHNTGTRSQRIFPAKYSGQWTPAVVSGALEDGHLHIIRNTEVQEYCRNRKHLMDVKGQSVTGSAQPVSDDNLSSQETTKICLTMDSNAPSPTPNDVLLTKFGTTRFR